MNSLLNPNSNFFGLDIGTTAIRLVQLSGPGPTKTLLKYAYVPIDSNVAQSDSDQDLQKLATLVNQLVKQTGINTKDTAVGIPSSRVFTTVADVERLPAAELAKAIPYQADSLIPTPLEESKMDWALIGNSPVDPTKEEILITSVPNEFVEKRLDMLENLGLNVIAFEPDNLALARALSDPSKTGAQMVLDMGHRSTDIVVLLNGIPHLTRSVPTGLESIFKASLQNLKVDEKQAEQFVLKFGLSKDKLDGQVYEAISGIIDQLVGEVEKSIKFFQTRYVNERIGNIVVTGGASVIPEFPLYLANKFGVQVEIGNAWRNVSYTPDRQNELLAISNQFSVAVGLAERMS